MDLRIFDPSKVRQLFEENEKEIATLRHKLRVEQEKALGWGEHARESQNAAREIVNKVREFSKKAPAIMTFKAWEKLIMELEEIK